MGELNDKPFLYNKVRFSGGSRNDRLMALEALGKPEKIGEEEVLTDEERIAIEAIPKILLEWCRNKGLDLRHNLPSLDKVHVYTQTNFQQIRAVFGLDEAVEGCHGVAGDIYLIRRPLSRFIVTYSHEAIHGISKQDIDLAQDGDQISIEVTRIGLKDRKNGMLNTVNETITEMANSEMINSFWPKDRVLAPFVSDFEPSYVESLIFFDEMLGAMSELAKLSKKQLFDMAQKDMLLGKMDFLRMVSRTFGRGKMMPLAMMSNNYDDPRRLAGIFGLNSAIDKIGDLRSGVPIVLMEEIIPSGMVVMWE